MKKYILFLCLLTIGFVHAQDNDKDASSDKLTFEKGTSILNVGLFFSSTDVETQLPSQTQEESRFGIGINSSYGYAISDDLFLGLGIGYSHNTRKVEVTANPTSEFKINRFNIFPYIRYYKGIGKRLAFYVQGEVQYSKATTELNGSDFLDTDGFFVGVRPGLTFMLSKCLGLETSIGALGYTSSNTKNLDNNDDSDTREFNFSLDSTNLIFGLSYYF